MKSITGVTPFIQGAWRLEVYQISALKELGSFNISYQASEIGEALPNLLFGAVNSLDTAFALENGTIAATGEVRFDIRIAGVLYAFTGFVNGSAMSGDVISEPDAASELESEDGSWSAQAQGGGEDGDKRRERRKAAASR
jgi:hypothetical protein